MKFIIGHFYQRLFLLLTLTLSYHVSLAQQGHFIKYGEIEFEKKVNIFAKLYKSGIQDKNPTKTQYLEEYKKTHPQFYTQMNKLSFSEENSFYRPVTDNRPLSAVEAHEPWIGVKNVVYQNFKTDSVFSVKNIFGEQFVIKDKKQPVLWKLTDEVREIAGFKCKRANGLILDSIYVVAFFSEDIIPAGGPDAFSGLPGMILGVALPYENVTWFATKIEINYPKAEEVSLKLPQKKKPITRKEYQSVLKKITKNWGDNKAEALKASLL